MGNDDRMRREAPPAAKHDESHQTRRERAYPALARCRRCAARPRDTATLALQQMLQPSSAFCYAGHTFPTHQYGCNHPSRLNLLISLLMKPFIDVLEELTAKIKLMGRHKLIEEL